MLRGGRPLLATAPYAARSTLSPLGGAHGSRSSAPAAMAEGAGAGAAGAAAAVPPPPLVARSVWDVAGQPTEVLELAAQGAPQLDVLVLPGNPGAAGYYAPFMRSLQAHLGGGARVTAVSNLGMDAQGLTPRGTVYSLEQQIAHKQALLAQHFAGSGRPVVLLGHSIGTYIAIHAVHRLEGDADAGASRAAAAALDAVAAREWEHPDAAGASLEGMAAELAAKRRQQAAGGGGSGDGGSGGSGGGAGGGGAHPSNVVKIIGLFPFLQVDPDCSRQRRLRRITPHHALLARLAGGVGYLPLALRRALVRLGAGKEMDPHAVDVTAQVFTDSANVENGLYMGMTEFEALAAPADWWLLRSLGRRFAVFAAPDDIWFKRWKWDAMQREVPDVEAHWVEGQTHAFCVSRRQSEELAAQCASIVEAALQASPETAAAPAGTDSSRL